MYKLFISMVLVLSLFIRSSLIGEDLKYGQVITKDHTSNECIVVIQGYTENRILKQKTIYLNSSQYDYTNIGDFVDIGRGNYGYRIK